MREVTIRIRFSTPSLGDAKAENGIFKMPKSPEGKVMFLPTWWSAGMRTASQMLGRYQDQVSKILWDPLVDGTPIPGRHYRRYFDGKRFALHECFHAGQVVGINCGVPPEIPIEDLHHLLDLIGRYVGVSPYKPREFGRFVVESVRPRTLPIENTSDEENSDEHQLTKK